MRTIASLVVALFIIGRAPAVHANLSYFCNFDGSFGLPGDVPEYPWFGPQKILYVYAGTYTSGYRTNPWSAAGMTQAKFEAQLQKTIAIFNEQLGSTLRLRYVGTSSTSASYITGSVLVIGDTEGGNGYEYAQIYSTTNSGFTTWKAGVIAVNKYLTVADRISNTPIQWSSNEFQSGGTTDIVYAFLHEFGHAVIGSDHIENAANYWCQDIGQYSYMRAGYELRPPAHRTIKNYDAEVAQHWYGPRSQYSTLYRTYYQALNTWTASVQIVAFGAIKLMFRMGSMGQDVDSRNLTWLYNSNGLVKTGGGGTILWSRYNPFKAGTTMTSDGLRRPIALATKPSNGELFVAYQRYQGSMQDPYAAYSDVAKLCYRRSTNNGVTWTSEVCDGSAATRRYGLTATYDVYSDAFLVGYISDSYLGPFNPVQPGGADDYPWVAVWTVPATGSSTPMNRSASIGWSYEAPAIACSGASSLGCRVVYDDYDTGNLMWWTAGVNPTTGQVSFNTLYVQGYLQFDTPSVVYNPSEAAYRLAFTSNNNAVYSYTMSAAGTSWVGTGDIFNNANSYISPAVLSLRNFWAGRRLYAWYARFK